MAVNKRKPQTRHERAICALLTAPTMAAAAIGAGISETTLYRWLRDTAFSDKYREARLQAVQHAQARLSAACSVAVDTLLAIMQDPEAPTTCRVSAARSVLELAIKGERAESEALEDTPTDVKITIGDPEVISARAEIEAKLAQVKAAEDLELASYTTAELQQLREIYEAAAARRGRPVAPLSPRSVAEHVSGNGRNGGGHI